MFKAEWQRIQGLVMWASGLHIVLLLLLLQMGLVFSHSVGLKISIAALYVGWGLLFAVLQIRLYQTEGQWLYWLNRPLSETRVLAAWLLASGVHLVVVIALPWLLLTAAMDGLGSWPIDWRHYAQVGYLLGLALSGYLLGVAWQLLRRRWAAVLLILPILSLMGINLGGHAMRLQGMVLVLLLALCFALFTLNWQQPKRGPVGHVVLALLFGWCGFMLCQSVIGLVNLTVAEINYLNSRTASTNPSSQAEYAAIKQFSLVAYLSPEQRILAGLSALPTVQYERLALDLALSEAHRIRKRVWFHPTQQQFQLMDERPLVLVDEDRDLVWQFSHDERLFIGQHRLTLEPAGYLGPEKQADSLAAFGDDERFSAVPWISGQQLLVGHQLYAYETDTQSIRLLFQGTAGERLLNVLRRHGAVNGLLTTQHLYVFDDIDRVNKNYPLQAVFQMPLPDDYNNIWDAVVAETRDRFVLSFLLGKDPRNDAYAAAQKTWAFDLTGQVELLAERSLQPDTTVLMRHLDYVVSPLWTVITDRWPALPGRDRYVPARPWPEQLPPLIWVLVLVVSLLSGYLTLRWAKQRSLHQAQAWRWAVFNAVTGLPGLLGFQMAHPPAAATLDPSLLDPQQPVEVPEVRHV